MGQTTTGYVDNYNPASTSSGCGSAYALPGLDRVYSISVGAGKTLTATVNAPAEDAAIYLLADVAACMPVPAVCLDGADIGGVGSNDVVTYMNSGASAVTVLIVIDSPDVAPMTFQLTTEIP